MGKSMITGIDLGSHAIRAVVLKPIGSRFLLMDYQELPVNAGIFSDNHTFNYQEIVNKLKELRKRLPLFSHRVSLALPDHAVINKLLQVDSRLLTSDLELVIGQTFSRHAAIARDEIQLDFVPVAEPASAAHHASYQVYATKKELIESRQTLLAKAGFKPTLFDTKTRSLVQLWQLQARQRGARDWLLVNIEANQLQAVIDFFDTAPYIRECALPESDAARSEPEACGDAPALATRLEHCTDEIKRMQQRLLSLHHCTLQGIWLTGSERPTAALSAQFTERLGLAIEWFDPFELLDTSHYAPGTLCSAGRFSVATSLALRGLNWLGAQHAR